MTRRSRKPISESTPQPLAIIAGLPSLNSQAVAKEITALFPKWKVIATPFSTKVDNPYQDNGAILDLVRSVCRFAEDQVDKTPPRPGRLVLFYVKHGDFDKLLDVFGFSVLAIPLIFDAWHWPQGQHWRSDPDAVVPLIQEAIGAIESGLGQNMKARLERGDSHDVLLLPPRNFFTPDNATLYKRFKDHHLAGTLSEIADEDIACETFNYERLPAFFAKTREKSKEFRIDKRGLVFATSRQGQHGLARMQNVSITETLSGFRPLLESLYRFGSPLREGFQHDVQWDNGKHLANVEFVNIDKPLTLSQSHANIYANDRVR